MNGFKNFMNVVNTRGAAAAAILAGGLVVGAAPASANPVDPVSNPDKLKYSDVEMKIPDYDVPFKRDGLVSNPDVFKQIVQGVPASEVQTLIGDPLGKTSGSQGPEWNYNFTLLLPRSENYMVCQYKVVFDGTEQVKETVWRSRQCLDRKSKR